MIKAKHRVKFQYTKAKPRYSVQRRTGLRWKTVKGLTFKNPAAALKKVQELDGLKEWTDIPIYGGFKSRK